LAFDNAIHTSATIEATNQIKADTFHALNSGLFGTSLECGTGLIVGDTIVAGQSITTAESVTAGGAAGRVNTVMGNVRVQQPNGSGGTVPSTFDLGVLFGSTSNALTTLHILPSGAGVLGGYNGAPTMINNNGGAVPQAQTDPNPQGVDNCRLIIDNDFLYVWNDSTSIWKTIPLNSPSFKYDTESVNVGGQASNANQSIGGEKTFIDNLHIPFRTLSSSSDPTTGAGEVCCDGTYMYFSDGATWKRVTGSTF